MSSMMAEYPENGSYMFRYERHGSYLHIQAYKVMYRTNKGTWITKTHSLDIDTYKRFVLHGSKKRFAYDTREEARVAFLFRKKRQFEILTAQLNNCQQQYAEAGGELPIECRVFTSVTNDY